MDVVYARTMQRRCIQNFQFALKRFKARVQRSINIHVCRAIISGCMNPVGCNFVATVRDLLFKISQFFGFEWFFGLWRHNTSLDIFVNVSAWPSRHFRRFIYIFMRRGMRLAGVPR